MDKWFNVNKDIRVWAGHSAAHKQGWIYAPAAIRAIEEYQGSYRFEECKVVGLGRCDFEADPGYPQFWVRKEDVSTEPYEPMPVPIPVPDPEPLPVPEPVPSDPGDEELGRALRIIFNALASAFRGPSSSNIN